MYSDLVHRRACLDSIDTVIVKIAPGKKELVHYSGSFSHTAREFGY